jgi:hypothetical protein
MADDPEEIMEGLARMLATQHAFNCQQRKGFRPHCSPRASVRQTERFLAPQLR